MNKFTEILIMTLLSFLLLSQNIEASKKINKDEFKKITTAIKKFNQKFTTWKTSDYTATVQKSALEKKEVPYEITLDINKDGKLDYFVNGHDGKNLLFIAVISNKKTYVVTLIESKKWEKDEKKEHSLGFGQTEVGLHYHLDKNEKTNSFKKTYPKELDELGETEEDGSIIDFDGTYEEFLESKEA